MDGFAGAASWDLEQSYESRPRTLKQTKRKDKESNRLPIKTSAGIQPSLIAEPSLEDSEPSGDEESADEQEDEQPVPAVEEDNEEEEENEEDKEPKKSEKQRVVEAKEELARVASMVQEDPEENIGLARRMRELTQDHSPTIQRLALVALMSVYKDVIPGYRIRPLSDEEAKSKVSKEVKKLRAFEGGLLTGYKEYLDHLLALLRTSRKTPSPAATTTAKIAMNCATSLLAHVPHFNFRSDLLKLIIEVLSVRTVDDSFTACLGALRNLFANDSDGPATLEAVTLLTRMFKSRGYRVHESVLNTFLSLRLLSELDVKASDTIVENQRKRKKKDREFRTKKLRKTAKENKELEKELREADAIVSYEEREKMQSETLKMVFVTYFKILRDRPLGLMGATLEGLAKFAHLINVDFFGDLLVALKELVTDAQEEELDAGAATTATRNATRESLLCVITAFTLLQHQGDKMLPVDLNFFTNHLYTTLFPLALDADIELSHKSLRLPDPNLRTPTEKKVNVATEVEMLIRALDALLFKQNQNMNPQRVAAFTKRLLTSTLHLPEKSAMATVGTVVKVGKKYRNKVAGLWSSEESVGDGVYRMDVDEPERSNPGAATVWEMVLLESHYSPLVKEAMGGLVKEFKGR